MSLLSEDANPTAVEAAKALDEMVRDSLRQKEATQLRLQIALLQEQVAHWKDKALQVAQHKAPPQTWRNARLEPPKAGQNIVKLWVCSCTVLAGVYRGPGRKQDFDFWMPVDELGKLPVSSQVGSPHTLDYD